MAGGMELGLSTRGGRRPLDTAINLVPFIDLMAVLISFLLLTAVWTQQGRLPAQPRGEGDGQEREEPPLTVVLSASGLRLDVGGSVRALPLSRDARGRVELAGLRDGLARVHQEFPARRDLTLQTDDDVRYDDLVHVMDACIGSGFDQVQVSPSVN